jgi:hypothetical protein
MDGETTNIIRVGLKRSHLLVRIVIKHPQMKIIRPSHEPIFARDKADAAYGYLGDFKRFDERARVVIVNVDGTVVETCDDPWFSRVEIDGFDAVGPCGELFLDV